MDIKTKEKMYELLTKNNISDIVDKVIYRTTDKLDEDINTLDSFIIFQSLTLNTSNIPKFETIYQISIYAKTSMKVGEIEKEILQNINKTRNKAWKICILDSEKEGYDVDTGLNKLDMTFRVVGFNTLY